MDLVASSFKALELLTWTCGWAPTNSVGKQSKCRGKEGEGGGEIAGRLQLWCVVTGPPGRGAGGARRAWFYITFRRDPCANYRTVGRPPMSGRGSMQTRVRAKRAIGRRRGYGAVAIVWLSLRFGRLSFARVLRHLPHAHARRARARSVSPRRRLTGACMRGAMRSLQRQKQWHRAR